MKVGRGWSASSAAYQASAPVMRYSAPVAMLCSALSTIMRRHSPGSLPHQKSSSCGWKNSSPVASTTSLDMVKFSAYASGSTCAASTSMLSVPSFKYSVMFMSR